MNSEFNQNLNLIIIDEPILLLNNESEGFLHPKFLESDFESLKIQLGMANGLSLLGRITTK